MKKKGAVLLTAALMGTMCVTGCGDSKETTQKLEGEETAQVEATKAADATTEEDADKKAADEVAALIDAIYVQERTDETDQQCADQYQRQ